MLSISDREAERARTLVSVLKSRLPDHSDVRDVFYDASREAVVFVLVDDSRFVLDARKFLSAYEPPN